MAKDIKDPVDEVMTAFNEFVERNSKRLDELQQHVDEIATEQGRPFTNSTGKPKKPAATYIDVKTRAEVPVLGAQDKLEDLEPRAQSRGIESASANEPSLGRVLRGIVLGNHAHDAKALADERMAMGIVSDTGGGYLLDDGRLSSRFIDLVRDRMVLNQAGVQTIPMSGHDLSLLKLTADPSCSWHGENKTIPDSEPTFGRVKLTAKTIVCKVVCSLELMQDAANLQDILERSITAAMAGAIDDAGLNGVTENAAAAPSTYGIFNLDGRKTVTSIGAPTNFDFIVDGMYELLAENKAMSDIGAMVSHPALWKKLRKLKTGITSDQTPLTMPQEVAALPKLWTTSAPFTGGNTAKAVIADWRDLLFGVRKAITVRVLSTELLAEKLQVAVLAYARCDFAATRAASFCTLEGITV